tara:strand:+ start:370 stop:1068 length:699 start_codon:yes stop_codon:yes gene_type:complete
MKRIAIIPARGGSKRIQKKNIKNFCGKPIISYPIKAIIESKLFDKIHISTDDKEVVEVVNKLGVDVDFYRPKSLSDDFTSIVPVVKYVVDRYKKMNQNYNEVWVILPCSPLLKSNDLIEASILFNKTKNSNSLMSVTEYPAPVEWAFKKDKKGNLKPLNEGAFKIRSQDLDKKYYDAGMFYIYSELYILNTDYNGSDTNIIPYLIDKGSAIDIDDNEDWIIAEKLFKINLNQ